MSERTQIATIRHTMDELSIYDVTETELTILEQGTAESLQLNISIFLLSVFLSLLPVLITTPMDLYKYATFCCIDVLSGFIGTVLLLLAVKKRKSSKTIIREIRSRKKTPEGIVEETNIEVT